MGPKLGDQNWGTKAGGPKLDDKNWGTKTDRCLSLKFPQSTRILPNQPEFPNLPKCSQIPHVLLMILVMRSFRLRYAFVSFWRGPRYEKKGTKGKNKIISMWGYEEELIAIKMVTTTTMASFFHRGQAIKCSDNFSGKSETEQMQN